MKTFPFTFILCLIFFFSNRLPAQIIWTYKEKPVIPIQNPTTSLRSSTTDSSLCPPNINFEEGSFRNWKFYKGFAYTDGSSNYVVQSLSTLTEGWMQCDSTEKSTTSIQLTNTKQSKFQLISASSLPLLDPYGGFPRLCPNDGKYSVQLGNSDAGTEAERISYTYQIPKDQNRFVLKYYYAVVLQDPLDNHTAFEKPRFRAMVYDADSKVQIGCASYDFTTGTSLPGFQKSTVSTSTADVWYKPWTEVSINLSGYVGHTVVLDFITEDCARKSHFGYAYLDVNSDCATLVSGAGYCQGKDSMTLKAPSGYQSYTWYNADYSQKMDTGQTIVLSPLPEKNTTFNVDMIPYDGFGCRDTAITIVSVSRLAEVAFNAPTAVCKRQPVTFDNQTTIVNNTPLTYIWEFGDGTYSTLKNPVKIYTKDSTFQVSLIATNSDGCSDTLSKSISVYPLPQIIPIQGNAVLCKDSTLQFTDQSSGGKWESSNTAVATISQDGWAKGVKAGNATIRYIVTNQNLCADTALMDVMVIAPVSSVTKAFVCLGENYWFNGQRFKEEGKYAVHLAAQTGCDSTAWLLLSYYPTYNIAQTIQIFTGETFTQNGKIYSTSGSYTDTLRTVHGCDSIVTITLQVIFVPNSITPNGDGKNDIFMKGIPVKIYNRNGILIYEGEDGWDGTHQGKPVAKDTYFFVFTYLSEAGERKKEGYVMVIR
ncbi:MAG: PKD domain-containing protein [Bacteroidota bacterium]|nr:PKD domain-containing protein [Bacteroidota bacterium]